MNSQPSTNDYQPSPQPPLETPLPAPHEHILIQDCLGRNRERLVYSAIDTQRPEKKLVVEFLRDRPNPVPPPDTTRDRYLIDLPSNSPLKLTALPGWADSGLPAAALVTALPCRLPAPYQQFTLQQFIGIGGFGQVWMAASENHPGVSLAVKFLTHPAYPTQQAREFLQEVQAGLNIDHPCVVRTFQALKMPDEAVAAGWPLLGLVMRRHEPSLAEVIRHLQTTNQRLPQALAVEWSRNLCDALNELHGGHQLVHRDLKPSNVLLRLPEGQFYYGPESLPALGGSTALLSDLGTVCRAGRPPLFRLLQDGWKAPELFVSGSKDPDRKRAAEPAEDLYAFGLLLQALAGLVEGSPDWLHQAAVLLMHPDPAKRPAAGTGLRLMLSPDWHLQQFMFHTGWRPEAHADFIGRQFVFQAFDQFAQTCREQNQGGLFLVEGEAGIGKTALLTEWVRRDGPHPAFFFRRQEGRTRVSAMPEMLFNLLCRRYQIQRFVPAKEEQYADALADLIGHLAREGKLSGDRPLLLFVDGLDEADDPEKAVQMLPKPPLPAGVFVIAASRPRIGDRDHLADLHAAVCTRVFELVGTDGHNLDDLEQYLHRRLAGRLANGQARALAEHLGGIFQLAIYLTEAILEGSLDVSQALHAAAGLAQLPTSQKILAWYQQSWERILRLVPARDQQDDLRAFVCLLAAAQAPLGEKQILKILKCKPSQRDWAQHLLRWLLVRRVERTHDGYQEAYLQLRHQSVYDFLVSVEFEGPARDGLEETHAQIARFYLEQGDWAKVEPYGRSFAVRHMLMARQPELLDKAVCCLTNLTYLQATLGEEPPGTGPAPT